MTERNDTAHRNDGYHDDYAEEGQEENRHVDDGGNGNRGRSPNGSGWVNQGVQQGRNAGYPPEDSYNTPTNKGRGNGGSCERREMSGRRGSHSGSNHGGSVSAGKRKESPLEVTPLATQTRMVGLNR